MTDKVVIQAVDGSGTCYIRLNNHIIGTISSDGMIHGDPLIVVGNPDGTITINQNNESITIINIDTSNVVERTPIQPGDVIPISSEPTSPVVETLKALLRTLFRIVEGPIKRELSNDSNGITRRD